MLWTVRSNQNKSVLYVFRITFCRQPSNWQTGQWDSRSIHTVRFALRVSALLYICFCEIVHSVQWVWMWFAMYFHWNCTLQSHRIGMEPILVWHHTKVCITCRASHTMWTVSLTTTQSNFCILTIAVAPYERALKIYTVQSRWSVGLILFNLGQIYSQMFTVWQEHVTVCI